MIKSKIVLLSALVSCALISGCKEENKNNVSIEFMHSSVEQERQAVISKLIARFEKENPGITVKQVPVEEDAYNTKVITLSRSGSLPEVIETSHDYAKVMDKEQLIDRQAVATVISNVGEGAFYDGVLRIVRTEDGSAWTRCSCQRMDWRDLVSQRCAGKSWAGGAKKLAAIAGRCTETE